MTTEILEKEKVDLLIPITEPLTQFSQHLNEKGNHRILFSSPFGTGKTTFLKEFFKGKEEKYKVFHLYPVNYQVADNKDIFELLKFDILTELIPSIDFTAPEYDLTDMLLASQYFLMNNGANLALDILKGIPKLGKTVNSFEKIIKFCSDLHESFKQPENDKFSILDVYAQGIESKEGSIYEMDSISHFISEEIQKLTDEGDGEKESVLIIDDLDRVDPRHIFRLLNVFSAHFDQDYPINNKFGFSKIIMVCDIENIEIIYRKMYGEEVDFSGYIDKFRSIETFYLQNEENWFAKVDLLFHNNGNRYFYGRYNREIFHNFGVFLVKDLIYQGLLNYRKLLKAKNYPELMTSLTTMTIKSDNYYLIERLNVYELYKLIYFLFDGNTYDMQNSINKLELLTNSFLSESLCERHLNELIYILHLIEYGNVNNQELNLNINNQKIKYSIINGKIENVQVNVKLAYKDIYWVCNKVFSLMSELI